MINSVPPFVSLLAVALVASLALACGGGDDPACPTFATDDACSPASADDRIPFVTPLTIHTGANGRDTYQAVIETNFGDLSLETSAGDVACAVRIGCIAPGQAGISSVVTAHSPGTATITVRSGGYSEAVTVVVESYTAAQYDLGEERYLNPANENQTDRIACGDCHLGQGGAPHSPLSLAGNSDIELLGAVETSQYAGRCEDDDTGEVCDCTPSGSDCGACPGTCQFNEGATLSLEAFGGGPGDHTYNLTADERIGVMAYMRAIRPEGI